MKPMNWPRREIAAHAFGAGEIDGEREAAAR